MRLLISTLFCIAICTSVSAQQRSPTYAQTRELLVQMDGAHYDRCLRQLFEEAQSRKQDLISALYDPDKTINVRAQRVMKYLAQPDMLAAIEQWYEYRKKLGQDYWWPHMELFAEVKYLKGNGNDLAKLVVDNLYSGQPETRAKVVAYNKQFKTALIEVVYGETFTEGRHVVIREENDRWRLLSENVVWQS